MSHELKATDRRIYPNVQVVVGKIQINYSCRRFWWHYPLKNLIQMYPTSWWEEYSSNQSLGNSFQRCFFIHASGTNKTVYRHWKNPSLPVCDKWEPSKVLKVHCYETNLETAIDLSWKCKFPAYQFYALTQVHPENIEIRNSDTAKPLEVSEGKQLQFKYSVFLP